MGDADEGASGATASPGVDGDEKPRSIEPRPQSRRTILSEGGGVPARGHGSWPLCATWGSPSKRTEKLTTAKRDRVPPRAPRALAIFRSPNLALCSINEPEPHSHWAQWEARGRCSKAKQIRTKSREKNKGLFLLAPRHGSGSRSPAAPPARR